QVPAFQHRRNQQGDKRWFQRLAQEAPLDFAEVEVQLRRGCSLQREAEAKAVLLPGQLRNLDDQSFILRLHGFHPPDRSGSATGSSSRMGPPGGSSTKTTPGPGSRKFETLDASQQFRTLVRNLVGPEGLEPPTKRL